MSTRIIAVDYGTKIIGLAVAGAATKVVSPLMHLPTDHAIAQIVQAVRDESADLVIVGLPRGDGSAETDQSMLVRRWAALLAAELDVSVELVDEFGTTQMALERLAARGITRDQAKQNGDLDMESAVILLEGYVNSLEG